MVKATGYQLSHWTCFATSMAKQIFIDPLAFGVKVGQKLGLQFSKNSQSRTSVYWKTYSSRSDGQNIKRGSKLPLLNKVIDALPDRASERQSGLFSMQFCSSVSLGSEDISRVIYYVGNSLPHTQSGYSIRTHNIAQAALEGGLQYKVVTRLGYPAVVGIPSFDRTDLIDGVTYSRLIPRFFPLTQTREIEKAALLLAEETRKHGGEAIHTTTGFHNALVASRAAQILGIPWIYEVRGELEKTWLTTLPPEARTKALQSDFYNDWRKKETNAALAASKVIVLSEISRKQLAERGVPIDEITVLPNACSDSLLGQRIDKAELRAKMNLPTDKILIGSVTSVVAYEGLDDLISALPLLPENIFLLLVGDGSQRRELEQLAITLGVGDRVIFAGRQDSSSIAKWYSALDIFVVPRKNTEVCRTVTPIKPLDAMALNIPVVASDLPALREVTGNHASYFTAENIDHLSESILKVLSGKYDYEAAERWAASRTWKLISRRLCELYTGSEGQMGEPEGKLT